MVSHELCQISPSLCKLDWHWTSVKQPIFPHEIQVLRQQKASYSNTRYRVLHCYLYEAQILRPLSWGRGYV